MKSYVFITTEGSTFQPGSESAEPDIENCQALGISQGDGAQQAFENLIKENRYLLDTRFDEVVCMELKLVDGDVRKSYFYLSGYRER